MLRIQVPAKVNLYLRVLAKRSDGYHSIETVFHSIGLWDEIRLADSPRFRFSTAGLPTPAGVEEEHLRLVVVSLVPFGTGDLDPELHVQLVTVPRIRE